MTGYWVPTTNIPWKHLWASPIILAADFCVTRRCCASAPQCGMMRVAFFGGEGDRCHSVLCDALVESFPSPFCRSLYVRPRDEQLAQIRLVAHPHRYRQLGSIRCFVSVVWVLGGQHISAHAGFTRQLALLGFRCSRPGLFCSARKAPQAGSASLLAADGRFWRRNVALSLFAVGRNEVASRMTS